jgi:hypothetical protein
MKVAGMEEIEDMKGTEVMTGMESVTGMEGMKNGVKEGWQKVYLTMKRLPSIKSVGLSKKTIRQ